MLGTARTESSAGSILMQAAITNWCSILFVHHLSGQPRQTWRDSGDVSSEDAGAPTFSKRKIFQVLSRLELPFAT